MYPKGLRGFSTSLAYCLARRPPPPPPKTLAEGTRADDDMDATLQALRAEYGTRLGEKMRELMAAMERARAANPEALEEAFQLVHKLHGTAGSYGFHAVSGAARHLESLLKPAREAKGAVDWRTLDAALARRCRQRRTSIRWYRTASSCRGKAACASSRCRRPRKPRWSGC